MSVCFWEDLVNTVQEDCGGGGGGFLSFAGAPSNCGGTPGRFVLDQSMADVDLDAALTTATEVTITGVYEDDILVAAFENDLGDEIPGYVTLADVDYPLTFSGFYGAWATDNLPALDASVGFWFRVDVDGIIYYGASPLTTSC